MQTSDSAGYEIPKTPVGKKETVFPEPMQRHPRGFGLCQIAHFRYIKIQF